MNGKIVASFVVVTALIAGVAIYWLQLYAFYEEIDAERAALTLTQAEAGTPEPITVTGFQGIDGTSSPIRFRACFSLAQSLDSLSARYAPYPQATPLIAPGWFDCFDAVEIGRALEAGEARAFLAVRDISDGVDRVIAVFPDGRAFAWHQLNEKYQD